METSQRKMKLLFSMTLPGLLHVMELFWCLLQHAEYEQALPEGCFRTWGLLASTAYCSRHGASMIVMGN